MIVIHMHFFRDLYVKLRASGVLSETPDTLVTSKSSVGKERTPRQSACERRVGLKSQLLNVYCGPCSFNLVQARVKFSLRGRVPKKMIIIIINNCYKALFFNQS